MRQAEGYKVISIFSAKEVQANSIKKNNHEALNINQFILDLKGLTFEI